MTQASVNRDEIVFPNLDAYVLNRPNIADHLAFGRSPLFCAVTWRVKTFECLAKLFEPGPVPRHLQAHLRRRGAAQHIAGVQRAAQAEHFIHIVLNRAVVLLQGV